MRGVVGVGVFLASVVSVCPAAAEQPDTFWGLVDEIGASAPLTLREIEDLLEVPLREGGSGGPNVDWVGGPVDLGDGVRMDKVWVRADQDRNAGPAFGLGFELSGACVRADEVERHFPGGGWTAGVISDPPSGHEPIAWHDTALWAESVWFGFEPYAIRMPDECARNSSFWFSR